MPTEPRDAPRILITDFARLGSSWYACKRPDLALCDICGGRMDNPEHEMRGFVVEVPADRDGAAWWCCGAECAHVASVTAVCGGDAPLYVRRLDGAVTSANPNDRHV